MIKRFLIAMIHLYQRAISPHLGASCRFLPTCSHYAVEAIEIHGAFKGSLLAFWRILRCNPLSKGGFDPVPVRRDPRGPAPHKGLRH